MRGLATVRGLGAMSAPRDAPGRSGAAAGWALGRGDRGNATLAVVALGAALAVGLAVGAVVLAYVACMRQAGAASDLAALTAAIQAADNLDDAAVCSAAGETARRNGARLVSCDIVRAAPEVAACVEVAVRPGWTLPGLPAEVTARSYAGNPGGG